MAQATNNRKGSRLRSINDSTSTGIREGILGNQRGSLVMYLSLSLNLVMAAATSQVSPHPDRFLEMEPERPSSTKPPAQRLIACPKTPVFGNRKFLNLVSKQPGTVFVPRSGEPTNSFYGNISPISIPIYRKPLCIGDMYAHYKYPELHVVVYLFCFERGA